MDADEAYHTLAIALRHSDERADRLERELTAVRAQLAQLVEILIRKGTLAEGHHRVFEVAAETATRTLKPRVRLRQYIDKYTMSGNDIDCASRLHLCQARCCGFSFELTLQDLDEGRIAWEVAAPYLIRHERDGYCAHLDRENGHCREHAHRPAACRGYDCRGDARVWIDFDQRIPAPLPDGLTPPPFARR
jgi:Fe-S-cluster containining protein